MAEKNTKNKPGLRFVIHKHLARSLHYDVRLEIDGVLVSWAVPKGPSVNPKDKRLAIRTEDHPLDYVDFEGVIPEGEYGAGTVMVWDEGTFHNLREEGGEEIPLGKTLDEGHIRVRLDGKKLKGAFKFIRMQRPWQPDQDQWLMIKGKDEEADASRNPVSTQPDSAKTGRTMQQIEREEG